MIQTYFTTSFCVLLLRIVSNKHSIQLCTWVRIQHVKHQQQFNRTATVSC